MKEFEIYDEASGKTLNIKANSLEEAETISEGIDFDDYEDGDFVMAKGGEVDENRMAIQKHRNKLVSLNSKSLTPSEHAAVTKAINIMDMLLDGELILSPEIEKMYKNEGGDIDEGQTDEELYSALTEMGYDYGEYGSDDFDDSGFSEMAINLGYRWDEENKLWFNKNMAKGGMVEYVLYGTKVGKKDWQEEVLAVRPYKFEITPELEKVTKKDGYNRLRIAKIDLSTPPDFRKIVKKSTGGEMQGGEYAKGGRVKKKWIQDALGGDEGSLRRTAKRKGLLRGDENLSMTDLKKLQRMGGKTAKRAHLAETLRKFDEGGMFSQDDLHKLVADMDEDEYDNFCAEYDLDCDDANEVENFIYDAKMYDAQKMIREIKSGKYK